MQRPLLVFRIGYMSRYDGIAKISGGGAHVEENGVGGEMWNFRAEAGRCYGYVMTVHASGINLGKISPKDWKMGQELDGVDIVFIAKKPGYGQVVVGWYKNATVFSHQYRERRGKKHRGDWDNITYLCEVDAKNTYLVPEEKRDFVIEKAKDRPGQSNVWYGDSGSADSEKFIATLRKYISGESGESLKINSLKGKGGRRNGKTDKDFMVRIEEAAIRLTSESFQKRKYTINSVEKDNRGWDLEATHTKHVDEFLRLEVKGHAGNVVQFELTPNEYNQMKIYKDSYRLCVVRNALTEPDLRIFVPKQSEDGRWRLLEENGKEQIQLLEKIAAKAAQIV